MGERILKYIGWVGSEGGLPMKMRLAMKTMVPSDKAKVIPDSSDVIAKFHSAAKELTGKEPPRF